MGALRTAAAPFRPPPSRRPHSRPPVWLVLVAAFTACLSTRASDLDQYAQVPMNKVYPYPSDEERAQIAARVTLRDEDAPGIDSARTAPAHERIHRSLEEILASVGAQVRAPAPPAPASDEAKTDSDAEWTDGPEDADDPGGGFGEPVRDYDVTVRVNRYEYTATWEKPTNWFFLKSEEEMAQVPGTCTHTAQLEVEIDVSDAESRGLPFRGYRLTHSGEDETKSVDPTCPYAQEALESLFARTLAEALPCLQVPLQNEFAARGIVLSHRHEIAGGGDVFETTLGSGYGAAEGLDVGIFRVQHSTGPKGRHLRDERPIAEGVFTERVEPDSSWIRVAESDISEPVLEGDVVRAVYREPRTTSLNPFAACREILEQR